MLLNKEVEVQLVGKNIPYYENLGYKIPRSKNKWGKITIPRGTRIAVKIEDLHTGSQVKVDVLCDYCLEVITHPKYYDYLECRKNYEKDACVKCQNLKRNDSVMKQYGVTSVFKLGAIKNKIKTTNLERYGVDNPTQNDDIKQRIQTTNLERYGNVCSLHGDEIKEKVKATMLDRYGVEYSQQNADIKAKSIQSYYVNGTCPTSSQQLEIYNLFKQNNYNVELNYPVSNTNLDVAIFIDNIKIDLEYDGYHWHQDDQKDRRRDEFLKSQGWKILRIKSGHKLPTLEQLIESINKLVTTDRTFTQIILDDWGTDDIKEAN